MQKRNRGVVRWRGYEKQKEEGVVHDGGSMKNPTFKHRGIKKKAMSYEKVGSEEIIFRLYYTNIVIIRPHEVVLNSGGYRTATTKRRMNQILEDQGIPYSVWQKKGYWHVVNNRSGQYTGFKDGMILPILHSF